MELWCKWQGVDEEGVFCTAHLHEDRVFNCPYKDAEERTKSKHPCSDYRSMDKDGNFENGDEV